MRELLSLLRYFIHDDDEDGNYEDDNGDPLSNNFDNEDYLWWGRCLENMNFQSIQSKHLKERFHDVCPCVCL